MEFRRGSVHGNGGTIWTHEFGNGSRKQSAVTRRLCGGSLVVVFARLVREAHSLIRHTRLQPRNNAISNHVRASYKAHSYQVALPSLWTDIRLFLFLPSTLVAGHFFLTPRIRRGRQASLNPPHFFSREFQETQHTRMAALNDTFSSFSGVGFILSVASLSLYLESQNMGTCMYTIWMALACLVHFFDSIMWDGNALNLAPLWCNTSTFRNPLTGRTTSYLYSYSHPSWCWRVVSCSRSLHHPPPLLRRLSYHGGNWPGRYALSTCIGIHDTPAPPL